MTGVDPIRHGLLFERFLHLEKSDPDIDIDFENGRREEVIQYVYDRYGRDHAAQVANIITYQPRLATRDSARVLGYPAAWSSPAGPLPNSCPWNGRPRRAGPSSRAKRTIVQPLVF
ncbi:hypothetical protein ACWGHM_13495 [Streptomyces sp. NPDC054904]